tara:strand:- start:79773 stop:80540 length:768 start_codon:yes stop_codon:yes gene_type:complete
MARLEGKVAIVTGAARGMGEATARLLVEQGACVVLGDVLDEPGRKVAEELGEKAVYVHLDVTDKAQWQAAVEASKQFGTLNVLVNNAAILIHKTIMDTTEEEFMAVARVNQLGVFLGMQSVFPSMKAGGGGSIINISSIDGFQAKNSLVAYAASKWAVRGMTKTAALEMGKYNIRVNSVHPGGVYTDMHGKDFMTREQADATYANQALPRVGMPSEVAAVTVFLAGDEASFSTGSEFMADGGWHAGSVFPALPQL